MEEIKVSNSEIQAFKSCRRRWWLTYYRALGIKRYAEAPTGPRQLGTKIHAALQGYYQEGLDLVETITELYQLDIEWYSARDDAVKVLELRKEFDLAHAMMSGYENWVETSGVDSGLSLVATESAVEVPIAALDDELGLNEYVLRGKLDARVQRDVDDARLFMDHKTVMEFTTPQKLLPIDEQMLFYHMLEELDGMHRGADYKRTDGALYNMIRKVKQTKAAKPPFYLRAEQRHNRAQLNSMWLRTITILKEIQAARRALDAGESSLAVCPPRPSRDCTWQCDFFRACPMFDDGSNVEGMLEEHFERRDPHERYNDQATEENVI